MASFIDTSALVKGYVSEPGSAWVVRLIQSDAISISELTLTEMGSALSRRVRERIMPAIQARTAWRRFRRDFRTFGVAILNERALLDAAILRPVRRFRSAHLMPSSLKPRAVPRGSRGRPVCRSRS